MVLRFFEPEKASEPLVRFFGIRTLLKLSISPKALLPIVVILAGRITSFNCVPLKASEPTSVIPVGSVMLVSFVPLNA